MKSSLNQCAKCGSKFTSSEKPLKLLPCLHSMCLDCLSGRAPPKKVTKPKTSSVSSVSDVENKAPSTTTEKESEVASESTNESAVKEQTDTELDKSDKSKDAVEPAEEAKAEQQDETEKTVDDGEKVGSDDSAKNSDETGSDAKNNENAEGESFSMTTEDGNSTEPEKESLSEDECNGNGDNNEEEAAKQDQSSNMESESVDEQATSSKQDEQEKNEKEEEKITPVTECPICRDPIVLESTEQPGTGLLDNMFVALDPDDVAEPSAEETHVCMACEEEELAESYCVQCEEWLCKSCVIAHKRVRITKDHVISPKDEVKVVSSRLPWEHLMTCKLHKQEQLKFFCEKCEKLTCRDCQLMDHKDHKYQFLDQAAEQYKARLKGSLALMGEKRNKLATNRDEIEQKLSNCKEQKDSLQQEILKQADVLVKGIRQAVWGVLSNLASFTDAATKRLNKEIDDVSDLVTKFDHCIDFMEDILSEGSSMSLLYSKGNVETKCRKVYHTQVDPQSLKGTLLIQYKHEVEWLLGNLSKIGAIYVNGVRYPPDKNGGQSRRAQQQQQGGHAFPDGRPGGMSATSPHLQHMANQAIPGQRGGLPPDWNKFLQGVSKPSVPPNMTLNAMASSLPPQLSLPNRRGSQSQGGPQWQGLNERGFPAHLVAGQLMPQQQQAQSSRPSFTPMRLHHRPATQGDHSPGIMRSPPQYRQGGEASGTSRSSHGTPPDPARPASAGTYDGTNSRPGSGDSGGPTMVDIKKEKRDVSPDCVIMSASMKAERPSVFQTTPPNMRVSETVLEMQRNLDDVLRAVSMDMSDNLEQIGPSKPKAKVPSPPPPPTVSTTSVEKEKEASPASPTDQELRENWQGGNSMPGFSLSQSGSSGDPNDDYCACCHNGGDVLCCDQCPRVYHLQCHIPELDAVPSGSFVCTLCKGEESVDSEDVNQALKRKAPGGLSDLDVKVCERILLDLFCHKSSLPFQEPVNRVQVPNYYKIITQPMDFTQIKCKLQRRHHNHYQSLKAFLYDLRQVFINCALYNKAGSEVGKAGKIVRAVMESQVARLIPQHLAFVQENPTPCFSALQQLTDPEIRNSPPAANGDGEQPSSPKRAKVDG